MEPALAVVAEAFRLRRNHARLRVRSHPELCINFVTVDFVIDAMCALAASDLGGPSIFNIVNESPTPIGVVVAEMCRSVGLADLSLVDESAFRHTPMTILERRFHAMIAFELPYLAHQIRFDNRRFRQVVSAETLPSPRVDAALLRRINHAFHEHRARQAERLQPRRISSGAAAPAHAAV